MFPDKYKYKLLHIFVYMDSDYDGDQATHHNVTVYIIFIHDDRKINHSFR